MIIIIITVTIIPRNIYKDIYIYICAYNFIRRRPPKDDCHRRKPPTLPAAYTLRFVATLFGFLPSVCRRNFHKRRLLAIRTSVDENRLDNGRVFAVYTIVLYVGIVRREFTVTFYRSFGILLRKQTSPSNNTHEYTSTVYRPRTV